MSFRINPIYNVKNHIPYNMIKSGSFNISLLNAMNDNILYFGNVFKENQNVKILIISVNGNNSLTNEFELDFGFVNVEKGQKPQKTSPSYQKIYDIPGDSENINNGVIVMTSDSVVPIIPKDQEAYFAIRVKNIGDIIGVGSNNLKINISYVLF